MAEDPWRTPISQSYPVSSNELDTPPKPLGPTAYPTREWIVAEGEVSILDKTWFITLPKGWTASSLPTTVDIRNYAEDLGGELGVFAVGDPHIVIRLTLSEFSESLSALDVIHGLRVADYSEEELAAISGIEPFDIAGYSGYVYQNSNGMGAQRAFAFDKNRVGLIVDILPLTSPSFDEASEVLATLRQE